MLPLYRMYAFRYSLPTDPESSATIFKTIHSTQPCSLSSFYQPYCCPCLILSSAIIIAITAVPNLNASHVFYRNAYREGVNRDPVFFIPFLHKLSLYAGNVSCFHNTNLNPPIKCIETKYDRTIANINFLVGSKLIAKTFQNRIYV